MSIEHHLESNTRLPRPIINLQHQSSTTTSSGIMGTRARKTSTSTSNSIQRKKMEYQRSLSQGSSGRLLAPAGSYFSLESLFFLLCLTASLLILPLVLPPLPPPPFLLLLLPIAILIVLIILAFMPSNARDITYTYV